MNPITIVALMILVGGFLGVASEASEPADAPASQPSDKPDPDVVQWRLRCDLEDGRRLLSDGSLLLDARFLPDVPPPEKTVPPQGVLRLLESETDHEFGLDDLERKASDGNYMAPGGIQLNRKYVNLLRQSPIEDTLRFRAKGPNDPVLILDGQTVVGVVMPMKSAAPPPDR